MKTHFLLLLLFVSGSFYLTSCGGDDEEPPVVDDTVVIPTDDEGTVTKPPTVNELSILLGGPGNGFDDSLVWKGKQYLIAKWDAQNNEISSAEEDITIEDRFTENEIWFKRDEYTSDRFGYPVGKGKWIDPLGKTGFNWEFEPDDTKNLYMNRNEQYPPGGGRQDWTIVSLTTSRLEFKRIWQGNQERRVWTKKN